MAYIEGGWPGANPKDTEFFRRAQRGARPAPARLAAFGATRRAGVDCDDPLVGALRDVGGGCRHPRGEVHRPARRARAAHHARGEPGDGARHRPHLREEGQTVFLDAEHFFDGYRANRDYALEVLRTAAEAGAEVVALCDTNGGMLPDWVSDVVLDVIETTGARVGIHCHNDSGCAVANSLAAVDAGATHVQGCINGYGERTGNADLVTVVANLELKLDRDVLPQGLLREAHPDRARRRRGHQRAAGLAPALRRRRPSPTRPACTPARSRSTPTSTSTSTRSSSATTCACSSPTWPGAPRSSSRAASSATT